MPLRRIIDLLSLPRYTAGFSLVVFLSVRGSLQMKGLFVAKRTCHSTCLLKGDAFVPR